MSHRVFRMDLQQTSTGTSRHIVAHEFGEPGARPRIYVQAAMHADEAPAMLVAHHLIRKLQERSDAIEGSIVVVPLANPVGLSQRMLALHVGRGDLGAGGNFNRRFPDLRAAVREEVKHKLTGAQAADSQTVRAALKKAIAAVPAHDELTELRRELMNLAVDAEFVLDLHTHYEGTVYMYTNAVDPLAADELGALSGCQALLIDRGGEPAPGGLSLDQACDLAWRGLADLGVAHRCFTATMEYRGQVDVSDELAEADAEALVQFMIRRGVIAGQPSELPEPHCAATPVEAVAHLTPPGPGVVVYHRNPGDRIAAGDLVAEVVDPAAEDPTAARAPVLAPCDGVLFGRLISRIARPGVVLASIATDDAAKVSRFDGDPYP